MKSVQFILAFLFVGISSMTFAQKDSIADQRDARKLVREGNKLYENKNYTDATAAYKKALGKNSAYKKATYNMGNALYQEKNYKEAIPQFALAAEASEDKLSKAEAFHNIGNAHMEGKNYQGAVDAYKNSLRNNPNDDETRYNLAVAQKLLDKEKQDQKNKDKNKDKNKNKNQDNKDQKKDKDKNGDQKDKQDPKDKNDKGDQNKDKQKQDPNKKDPKKPNKNPQQGKMSPQQIKQFLENLNNEEKKTQKKLNAKRARGKKVKQEKDW